MTDAEMIQRIGDMVKANKLKNLRIEYLELKVASLEAELQKAKEPIVKIPNLELF